jgi:hypothetical protein
MFSACDTGTGLMTTFFLHPAQSLVLPSTKVERVVFEMWREVLNTGAFGVTDRYMLTWIRELVRTLSIAD